MGPLVLIGISALFWGVDLQKQRSFGFQVNDYTRLYNVKLYISVYLCFKFPPAKDWIYSSGVLVTMSGGVLI